MGGGGTPAIPVDNSGSQDTFVFQAGPLRSPVPIRSFGGPMPDGSAAIVPARPVWPLPGVASPLHQPLGLVSVQKKYQLDQHKKTEKHKKEVNKARSAGGPAVSFQASSKSSQTKTRKFDDKDSWAIVKAKSALNDSKVNESLAIVKAHFGELPATITSLEKSEMPLWQAVEIIEGLLKLSKSWPGHIGEKVREKLNAVLARNPGWTTIKTLAAKLKGEDTPTGIDLNGLIPGEIAKLKFLPVVSCDVERSFSALKMTLSDRRRNFTVENLEKVLIVQGN
ncbi:hypothetical protein GE061_002382 [Apolygus lucorum]|uniref:Uncharacterized protein n=1 Tax=Apolygus lucorum TaxID=248454 RepID=A0A8S9X4X7_APOLU|nr:hypothetical protein GE061_002382 [Apolygus lucorum]